MFLTQVPFDVRSDGWPLSRAARVWEKTESSCRTIESLTRRGIDLVAGEINSQLSIIWGQGEYRNLPIGPPPHLSITNKALLPFPARHPSRRNAARKYTRLWGEDKTHKTKDKLTSWHDGSFHMGIDIRFGDEELKSSWGVWYGGCLSYLVLARQNAILVVWRCMVA
jgi:hypothetical protein